MEQSKIEQMLGSLNPMQSKAATYGKGPLLVLAGPGSGKTRVLTTRIAWLLFKGTAAPNEILAITFTNQAADEISQRLQKAFSQELPQVSTFHSWAYGLLKMGMPDEVPLTPIDEEFAKDVFKECASILGYKAKEASELYKTLSRMRQEWPIRINSVPAMNKLYEEYRHKLHRLGVCDFDEIILDALRLLSNHDALRQRLKAHVKWILIDEFQDVSPAQYELLKLIAPKNANITFVGDPCQSIYSFRGAEPELINQLQLDFPGLETIWLDVCYRCPQNFLDAASMVLKAGSATFSVPKLVSQKGRGKKIGLKVCRDEYTEARWIARTIEEIVGGLSFDSINFGKASGHSMRSFNEIAVLYRLNALGDVIERELDLHGIPVKRPGKAVKSINSDLKKVYHLWEIIHDRNRKFHLEMLGAKTAKGKLNASNLRKLQLMSRQTKPAEVLRRLAEHLEIDIHSPVFQGLLKRIRFQQDDLNLSMFLRNEADLLDLEIEAVSLLTLHAAKGLEFPVVFLAGCEDDLIPWQENRMIEEERRLFYVGLTRAEEVLYLSYGKKRSLWGQKTKGRPSLFLRDIPDNLLQPIKVRSPKKQKAKMKQLTLFD